MSGGAKEAPGEGQQAGGKEEETRASHPIIIPETVPEDGAAGYGEGLRPDTAAAVDFLGHWRTGGPWVLTAIPVEGGPTRTATLCTARDVERWIHDHSGGAWNLYFTVNAVGAAVRKKPTKAEIVAATGFHVDVIPARASRLTASASGPSASSAVSLRRPRS